jgi:glycine/D-amino acid oxidase-like deaminating enzyme
LVYLRIYLRFMQVDILIVGQGICGTLLSWFLHKEGKSFVVIDNAAENTSSKVAAGVMNPVTGRRYATTLMAEELLQFAAMTYKELGDYLGCSLLYAKSIIDFFPTPQMRNTFVDRISEDGTYLHPFPDQNLFNPFFNYDFGCGEIQPAYTVHLPLLLSAWRKTVQEQQRLRNEHFRLTALDVSDEKVQYDNITAEKIIFCDGVDGMNNPWFQLLPFSGNKGECLVIRCEGLNTAHIYKRGMLLVPLPEENLFWFGSNYIWDFEDTNPSDQFFQTASAVLQQWLKFPFEVISHKAAIRPATLERRPFVGFHPQHPSVGILNGMGTKGTSLAPLFANQLTQHIVHNLPLAPEADVQRFNRILSK